jgi:PAS domain S-box-containing protein
VTTRSSKPGDRPLRIVVIDDSPDDRAQIRVLLLQGSSTRYDFVEAATGAAGIQAILAASGGLPDCVVLDYRLPDIDAPEVLEALMGRDQHAACPVVVVTGDDDRQSGQAVLWAGAQDYVGKSWMTAESLTRAVENAMERWSMTRELGASAARLKLALEASKTGIWTWEVATNVVTWTPECHEITGLAEWAFGGSLADFLRLVHPDDLARVNDSIQAALTDRGLFQIELRLVRPDGEVRWIEDLGRASYDAEGRPLSMLGTITDITARKRTEALLAARERELRSVTDNTPVVIARFDRQLRHVFVNAAVERGSGRRVAEFLGKTNRELGMPAELVAIWDAALLSVFETGQATSIEFAFPSPDGERHHESRIVPELGPDGEIAFVLSVVHDVTERKNAENALRTSEARLARAQKAAGVGVWDWDLVTGTGTWTEETWRLFDREPFSEPISHAMWLGCIHPEDRDAAVMVSDAGIRSGTYHQEVRVLLRSGAVRWLASQGEIESDAGGRPVRMVGTVRDVTARHEAEAALRSALAEAQAAVRARDTLVSLVSHDLKGPLHTLATGIAVLDLRAPDQDRELVRRMARQARRMNAMIEELLDVARLHAGMPLELELQDTDLVELTRDVVEQQQQAAPAPRIELRATMASLVGSWDRKRLARVVDNLLSNAVKYSPRGGAVRVELESLDEGGAACARLRIIDEGIGIASDDLTRIFGWFSRAENARRTTSGGTGIGLAGAREIVEQHGGTIAVESEEGTGSTFTVTLPLARPAAS